MMDTFLKASLDSANDKAKYNENVKMILSDRSILAWILKYSAEEYRECSIDEIRSCIEGTPQVAPVSVMPGSTQLDKILGLNTENEIPNEGKVTFDIVFYALRPKTRARTQIFINVEGQKDGSPGYDLVPRGIFYCARIISSQMNAVISAEDYAVRKVYSIWICMEETRYANTIREYRICPRDIYGRYRGRERYDLLSVVMIRLPKNEDAAAGNALHRVLTTALSSRMPPERKEEILEGTYGIPMSYELKEAAAKMCNLADLVEERGIEKGIEKGIEQGIAQGIERGTELKVIQLVLKKMQKCYTVAQIAEALEEPEEKISRIAEVAQKYAPGYDERQILKELMQEKI